MIELSPAAVRRRVALLWGLAVGAIVGALWIHRVPQNPSYHAFADQRAYFGIPNFWNVISNFPFLPAGALGLWAWTRAEWRESTDRWPWLIISIGAMGVGVGSGYYHLHPNNQTLFWDRLPMTFVFMALFAAAIAERIHHRSGWLLLGPFLLVGVLSVVVWRQGELAGMGVRLFYIPVQFYPMLALPLTLLLFPARYSRASDLWGLAGLYLLAKVFEALDAKIFVMTGGAMGGHALKHFVSSLGLGWALWGLGRRQVLV